MEIINNTPRSNKDTLLWLLILVLTAVGVFANYYFGELAWALRFTGWIVLICVLVGLAAITEKGKNGWAFAKNAKIELIKVVWPKREETIKITMVIAVLVVATSIILWCVDSVLLWLVGCLTKMLV